METAKEILEAYQMIYAPYSNEICRLYVHIAHLYCACGQIRKAKEEFEKAQAALSKCYPPNHSFYKSYMYTSVQMALLFT